MNLTSFMLPEYDILTATSVVFQCLKYTENVGGRTAVGGVYDASSDRLIDWGVALGKGLASVPIFSRIFSSDPWQLWNSDMNPTGGSADAVHIVTSISAYPYCTINNQIYSTRAITYIALISSKMYRTMS